MVRTISRLRAMSVANSLFTSTSISRAFDKLRFVQYDPIRRPACAQDLILHQRVDNYRNGELSREYSRLGLEEDYLHVYGAMTRQLRSLLYPRLDRSRSNKPYVPRGLASEVFAIVKEDGPLHPRDLVKHFGRARVTNNWGGISVETTKVLEELQYYGLIRVYHRHKGVRVYEKGPCVTHHVDPVERAEKLAVQIACTLAPLPEASFRGALAQLQRNAGVEMDRKVVIENLLSSGGLDAAVVDGMRYLWPTGLETKPSLNEPSRVRFLAPFDPLVWDRRRFEHLWGWPYRFEAYIPSAKRNYGYYALPMMLGEEMIGWVNCSVYGNSVHVDANFAYQQPHGRRFQHEFDYEADRLKQMLMTVEETASNLEVDEF